VDFSTARDLIAGAVERRVTPAAVVEVGRAQGAIWRESFGRLTYAADATPTELDTIFDLASLTKVMATAPIVMRAIIEGRLTLDSKVGEFLEGWADGDRRELRVRHLLDHSSGLPAHRRFWEFCSGRLEYETALREVPLERLPGARSVYSDLGFMVLGFMVEAARGAPLDDQFAALRRAWDGATAFNPSRTLLDRIAPTEYDAGRSGAVHGEVHDENARALEGVAGHAGLFGTAGDVGSFARLVLSTFHAETALGTPSLMRTFTTQCQVPSSSRALGWDTMRPTSSCGSLMSVDAVGHTGFTGTSLWIDRARDLYVVLLTNRIHPTRANEAHIALRPNVHDAIVTAFDTGLRRS
jgi:CubicO group peptidase (beta-lactamase class C family)